MVGPQVSMGKRLRDIEAGGVNAFWRISGTDLLAGTYQPQPNRMVEIPKGNGKVRKLQIPCIRDRVVQGALKLILEAIFEADFCPNSYGYRPEALAAPSAGGSAAQSAAAYEYRDRSRFSALLRHHPT